MKKIIGALVALCLALCSAAALGEGVSWLDGMLEGVGSAVQEGGAVIQSVRAAREENNLALLFVEGELIEGDRYYDHIGTLNAIDELVYDDKNAGLLLVFNTPGGGLYEADELHHTVSMYKELTGRPVYAYMKQECCSGGIYAAMAADTIYASKMTITGSVGVYVETFSEAGLLEKLGIEREYIATGDNKVSGYPMLTESQRAIEQAMVDEGFEFFKQVIREGRNLTDEQMEPFLDGRILTALQAKEYGLIDEVLYYDEAIETIVKELGEDVRFKDVTPELPYSLEDMISNRILDWIMP